ncbi:MAG TPA: hypothetical protein IAA08_09000 [Candidatus Eubacterium avistercoris]|uniref:Uncharacterized protein n=1 Tax=Candidatus Eubacterium avistercoris TaxID=2838567 RepID=A0A9D2D3Y0_9FIRM|nr:hypothetical protein [Candidatus Eubacterium avistercoris]
MYTVYTFPGIYNLQSGSKGTRIPAEPGWKREKEREDICREGKKGGDRGGRQKKGMKKQNMELW